MRDKVLAYCARYEVAPSPEGLPPFPAGQRETRQHREWLTVYRARQRQKARAGASVPPEDAASGSTQVTLCPTCGRPLQRDPSIFRARRDTGKRSRPRPPRG